MPAIGNLNPLSVQYRDFGGEVKTTRMYGGPITDVTLPGFLTEFGALQTALDAVTIGVRAKQTWGEESIISNDNAASKAAQVESQMLVRCQSATTQRPSSFRLYTIDFTAFNYATAPAGDQVIIAGAGATAATTTLITAIEALLHDPENGEGLEVVGMEVVGK